MTTRFYMIRDINGFNGFGLPFCDDKYAVTLAAGVAQTVTCPDNFGIWLAVFAIEPGASIWISNGSTAAVPTGSVATTTSELNPPAKSVSGGDVISMITPDTTANIGICFYAISPASS